MLKMQLQNFLSPKHALVLVFVLFGLYGVFMSVSPDMESTSQVTQHPLDKSVSSILSIAVQSYPFVVALLLYLEKKIGWILGFSSIVLYAYLLLVSISGDPMHVLTLICLLLIGKLFLSPGIKQLYRMGTTYSIVGWTALGIFTQVVLTLGVLVATSYYVYVVLEYIPQ